jgi:hypothetical protein
MTFRTKSEMTIYRAICDEMAEKCKKLVAQVIAGTRAKRDISYNSRKRNSVCSFLIGVNGKYRTYFCFYFRVSGKLSGSFFGKFLVDFLLVFVLATSYQISEILPAPNAVYKGNEYVITNGRYFPLSIVTVLHIWSHTRISGNFSGNIFCYFLEAFW